MAMYIFAKNIREGREIKIFNHGDMKRDFTYIKDIISGIRLSIDKNYPCEVFNIGNHKTEKLMDVVKIIEEAIGKSAIIKLYPMQPGDVKESYADIEKSENMLGYHPTTNIKSGIIQFVDWFNEYYGDNKL